METTEGEISMKIKDYIIAFLLLVMFGFIYHNERVISSQLRDLNKIEPEYIIPAPKDRVEAAISQYYNKTVVVATKTQESAPAVKIQPKKIKPKVINLHNQQIIDKIAIYIKKKEGFSAHAYKDHTQYSNGYGTRALSSNEVITVKEANARLYKHIKTVIIPSFDGVTFQSEEQVYSAIDFSYNIGHNKFKQKIVRKNGAIDCSKMMAYNKVRDKNGNLVYNEGLAQRRFENFLACAAYEVIEE